MSTEAFTDGSSRGNPGPGGYGAIVASSDHVVELGGREDHTTKHRMELIAAIKTLESVKTDDNSSIELFSDSKYVILGITEWVHGWVKNNWIGSHKKTVEKHDLWGAGFWAAQKVWS